MGAEPILNPSDDRGFTLIELVMVIVLVAVVAVVAGPRLMNMVGVKASATARKLQSDISYAQGLAMTSNQRHRVYFNTGPAPANGYAVVNDSNNDGWGVTGAGEYARDPAGVGALSVTLNAGSYFGITITIPGVGGLAGPPYFVEFRPLGVPFDNSGQLTGVRSVTVNGGTTSQSVQIQPETGKVSTP